MGKTTAENPTRSILCLEESWDVTPEKRSGSGWNTVCITILLLFTYFILKHKF